MRRGFFVVGVLLLGIGVEPYLAGWGLPASVANVLSQVPTFSLSRWIFVGVGVLLLAFSFRRV